MNAPGDPFLENLWMFLRGDRDIDGFEAWLYAAPDEAEHRLGAALFLAVISADMRDWDEGRQIRAELRKFARDCWPFECHCVELRDTAVIDMGEQDPVFQFLDERAVRGEPFWWISAARCRICGQAWLIGAEERRNDLYCLRRLSPSQMAEIAEQRVWPQDFDQYETLLTIGYEYGRRVTFLDPSIRNPSGT